MKTKCFAPFACISGMLVCALMAGCATYQKPEAKPKVSPKSQAKGGSGKGPAPMILVQPQSLIVSNGGTAAFSVGATNVGAFASEPIFYQWQFNGVNISGATNPVLIINNVGPANVGAYNVIATRNPSVSSDTAYLMMSSGTPVQGALTLPVGVFTDPSSTQFGNNFTVCHNMQTNLEATSGMTKLIVATTNAANVGLDTGLEIWKRENVPFPPGPPLPTVVDTSNNVGIVPPAKNKLSKTQNSAQQPPVYYNVAVYLKGNIPANANVIVNWVFE